LARSYIKSLDLTSRAQEKTRLEEATAEAKASSGDELPEVTVADLPEKLRQAVASAGWDSLMPVQQKSIPSLLEGRDLIVQSKTGSGKTGAFLLPLFQTLDPEEKRVQALIMAPTRELARQIHAEFERLCGDAPIESVLVYGGVSYEGQNAALRGGAQVVIGTPGRILDHLERRTFTLDALRALILDEADEMLSMGFYPAMKRLKRYLPKKRQSMMFSATMPGAVRALAKEFLHQPDFLALASGNVNVSGIAHRFYVVDGMEKDRTLVRLIEMENPESAIIFCNTKREVEYLTQFLRNYGHDAGEISGDLSQKAREKIMARIRDKNLRFLIATDVAARGIDIDNLSHVFQYDVAQDPEYYVHRSGRTARAGKTGTAISIVTQADKAKLLGIAKRYDIPLELRDAPTDQELSERLGERITETLEGSLREASSIGKERAERFIPLVQELAREEPMLLALLLDELYHSNQHAPPAPELENQERAERFGSRDRDERSGGRGNRRRSSEDESSERSAEPSGGDGERETTEGDQEARPKRRKKRRRSPSSEGDSAPTDTSE
jgi:ATP-dependent RNA helicase DeaD